MDLEIVLAGHRSNGPGHAQPQSSTNVSKRALTFKADF